MGLDESEAPEWMREHLEAEDDGVPVLSTNWDAVQVWETASRSRQIAIGPSGGIWQRLMQSEMRCACEGLGVSWNADVLWRLGVLENEASKLLNKDRSRGPSPFNQDRRKR